MHICSDINPIELKCFTCKSLSTKLHPEMQTYFQRYKMIARPWILGISVQVKYFCRLKLVLSGKRGSGPQSPPRHKYSSWSESISKLWTDLWGLQLHPAPLRHILKDGFVTQLCFCFVGSCSFDVFCFTWSLTESKPWFSIAICNMDLCHHYVRWWCLHQTLGGIQIVALQSITWRSMN